MYKLIRGKPIKDIEFKLVRATSGKYRHKMTCDNIFCFDTETTSDYVDEKTGDVFLFDYNNPERAQNSLKHSLVYLWQFSIDDNVFIGRELSDFCDLLYELKQYCNERVIKFVYVHNLAFDFCFLQNIIKFDNVFARTPRHPMCATSNYYGVEFKCSYVLTSLRLETWAESLNLPVKKQVGLLDYNKCIRTPKTELTHDEIKYAIADLGVMYYGLKQYRDKYGYMWQIPLTHTGKMRLACGEVMEKEKFYCKQVTQLAPQTLDDYIKQAHAFIGGTVLCNWLYKRRTITNVKCKDISSSYPWVLINNLYPQSRFLTVPKSKIQDYMNDKKYLYIIRFTACNIESNFNCHFLSKSKCISISNALCDNGRVIKCDRVELILTSVDYEIFLKCYKIKGELDIIEMKVSKAGYLNNEFRRFVISLYKDKTTLKHVKGKEEEYQSKKALINSCYGDFVTKTFSDEIVYDYNDKNDIWHTVILDDKIFAKKLSSLNRKSNKNYKAFIQGVFVTAHARARIWDAVINGLDDFIVYTDTDSLKTHNYDGDYFEKQNQFVLTRHVEICKQLNISLDDLSPSDIHGKKHPIGIWDDERDVSKFRSLGCKQYMVEYDDGTRELTCAGVSKLAVKCFKTIEDFDIDKTLTEKELKNATDDKHHTAEKLTPYYSVNYPVVKYPDGYISRYKSGVCLMPTTFSLSITPNDLALLYGVVAEKLNKSYYRKEI